MKLNVGTVFEIKAHYEGDEEIQIRHVFATSETEAIVKFEQYNKQQEKKGFARLIAVDYPTVDNYWVIG